MELFETKNIPLAELLRADSLTEVVGQDHLLGDNGILTSQLKTDNIKSMILWGPPGCGKTTIARLIAKYTDAKFISLSAIFSGISDLKKIFEEASNLKQVGKQTILFIDEIHRFNKTQQDSFLPVIENGTIILVGATTENPSFELNNALLSRCQILILKRLDENALLALLEKAENFLNKKLLLTDEAKNYLISIADGDGRHLLNSIELLINFNKEENITVEILKQLLQNSFKYYDKKGENHYNLISALHKSVRGSDVNAAIYWCARMLKGGEDPKYILRRLTRIAVEDVGFADPNALVYAMNVWDSFEKLGSPEGELSIISLVVYLATAPKSNAVYHAWNLVQDFVNTNPSYSPPFHIINAPTNFMKQVGFGKNYIYDPDTPFGFSGQNYWPEELEEQTFYFPKEKGFEKEIKKRINYWKDLKNKINKK